MIIYERMTSEHIDGIMEVEHNCFTSPWHRNSFEKELTNAIAYYIVALDASDSDCCDAKRVIGYAGMWKIWDEAHITNIAVHNDYRGAGVGSRLLAELIEEVERDGVDYITLEVKKSNITAQNMYGKFGFEICGERKKYYENGENALIMTKEKR